MRGSCPTNPTIVVYRVIGKNQVKISIIFSNSFLSVKCRDFLNVGNTFYTFRGRVGQDLVWKFHTFLFSPLTASLIPAPGAGGEAGKAVNRGVKII